MNASVDDFVAIYITRNRTQFKGGSAERASRVMERPRIRWRLAAFRHAIIADHGCNAQPVIGEHTAAALGLAAPVILLVAPTLHRILVAPERQRQELAWVGERLETLDGNEAIHLFQIGLQRRGDVEIVLLAAGGGPHLEDHGNHRVLLTRLRICGESAAYR